MMPIAHRNHLILLNREAERCLGELRVLVSLQLLVAEEMLALLPGVNVGHIMDAGIGLKRFVTEATLRLKADQEEREEAARNGEFEVREELPDGSGLVRPAA